MSYNLFAMAHQEADFALGGFLATSLDVKTIDFSAPWTEAPCFFLIPFPTSSENIAAIVKPFDLKVKYSNLKLKLFECY